MFYSFRVYQNGIFRGLVNGANDTVSAIESVQLFHGTDGLWTVIEIVP